MANYTLNEMAKVIIKGTDQNAIEEIGRQHPALLHRLSILSVKFGDELLKLTEVLTEFGVDEAKTTPAPKAAKAPNVKEAPVEEIEEGEVEETDGPDYESMTRAELMKLVRERKLRKTVKGQKKVDFIEALEAADNGGGDVEPEAEATPAPKAKTKAKAPVVEEEEDDFDDFEDDDEEEGDNPYEGKPATELYKEAKARGLKVVARKPVKYYVDVLLKADALLQEEAANVEADEDEEDDWDI